MEPIKSLMKATSYVYKNILDKKILLFGTVLILRTRSQFLVMFQQSQQLHASRVVLVGIHGCPKLRARHDLSKASIKPSSESSGIHNYCSCFVSITNSNFLSSEITDEYRFIYPTSFTLSLQM